MASIDITEAPPEDDKVAGKQEVDATDNTVGNDNKDEMPGLENEADDASQTDSNSSQPIESQPSQGQHGLSGDEALSVPQLTDFSETTPIGTSKTDESHKAVAKGKIPKFNGRTLIDAALILIIIILGLLCWSLNSNNKTLKNQNSNLNQQIVELNANPQAIIQKQTQELLDKVGKLMTLPSGETPTIANVNNAAAAKKQSAFFNNAKDGDKVLMYVKAGEAILYRPSTNKIILVAPLTLNNTTAAKAK